MLTIPKNEILDDNLLLQRFSRHEHLLSAIASRFGFSYPDSNALVKDVFADGFKQCRNVDGCTSYRIVLSKIMVRKCILKVSSGIFTSTSSAASEFSWTDNGSCQDRSVNDMPLTMRSVFILHEHLGFNEHEVSELLNASVYKVRERFNKALNFLKS